MLKCVASVILALTLGLTASAAAHEAKVKSITIAHPWVRASPGGTTLTASFMEIKADNSGGDRLVSVSTPAAGRAEIHTHVKDGDIMKMRRVESLDVKPGEARILKPSGDHVMLLDLKTPLKEGDLVKLTLTFEKAGPIEIEATVEPAGAMGPHGMDHQPGTGDENMGAEHQHH